MGGGARGRPQKKRAESAILREICLSLTAIPTIASTHLILAQDKGQEIGLMQHPKPMLRIGLGKAGGELLLSFGVPGHFEITLAVRANLEI